MSTSALRQWLHALPPIVATAATLAATTAHAEKTESSPRITAKVSVHGPGAIEDSRLAGPLDRSLLERAAIENNSGLRAAEHRVRSLVEQSHAESGLPPPELMAWVWQVPLSRPFALGDAGMVMVGLEQQFPAPGSLGFKADAKAHDARAEAAMALTRARALIRAVDHAFADYVEASDRHHVHVEHQKILQRIAEVTKARYAAAGSLGDVAQAAAELARVRADLVTDRSAIETARARLNGLLSRPPGALLGVPVSDEPTTVHLALDDLLERTRAHRPEIAAANEMREAAVSAARASDREAWVPSFAVAGLYFAPVGPMPTHGYGINVSMSLPWLWGRAARKSEADRELLASARDEAVDTRVRAVADVTTAEAAAKGAERRYAVLVGQALPAARLALDAQQAGYTSGRTDLVALLTAERSVVDIRMDVILARSALDHALADLDWAAGGSLPRVPIAPSEGDDDAH